MASFSRPLAAIHGPWYTTIEYRFDEGDAEGLRNAFDISPDHEIVLPSSSDRPNNSSTGCVCLFMDHFTAGLWFPMHPFIIVVCKYFCISLPQLVPNSFRLLCGVVVLFRLHDIPLVPRIFRYFYYSKLSELGTFLFQFRIGLVFFDKMTTSNKHWKEYFFFLRLPERLEFLTRWQLEVAPQPPLKRYKSRSDFLDAAAMMTGQKYNIHKLLLEGILYIFGLSPIRTRLPTNLVEIMMRAQMAGKAKLSDSAIEANATEELASRGLPRVNTNEDPLGASEETSAEAGEGAASHASSGGATPSSQPRTEQRPLIPVEKPLGSASFDVSLTKHKRRRAEPSSRSATSGAQSVERVET
ncbi:uncharacterized protein LOC122048859 [Zingiber officinale]|uniref:uncharacterized protein LOC122048859 n=1 Tax=Zingiber officinale TaxID=94328 RepID=UPI001C4C62E0|nr:uncharacterized protein LOC122048859 [Zingiber officinale]